MINRLPKLVLIFGVLVLSALRLAAQTGVAPTKVSKADIQKLKNAARAALKDQSYRKISEISHHYDGKPELDISFLIITELFRPDRVRVTEEARDRTGVHRSDYIAIGKRRYLRKGNGPWQSTDVKKIENDERLSDMFHTTTGAEMKYECHYLGEQDLGGHVADVYEVIKTQTFRYNNSKTTTVKKIWFDKQHRFLKVQTDVTDTGLASHSQDITEYQYDTPITIEAPIK